MRLVEVHVIGPYENRILLEGNNWRSSLVVQMYPGKISVIEPFIYLIILELPQRVTAIPAMISLATTLTPGFGPSRSGAPSQLPSSVSEGVLAWQRLGEPLPPGRLPPRPVWKVVCFHKQVSAASDIRREAVRQAPVRRGYRTLRTCTQEGPLPGRAELPGALQLSVEGEEALPSWPEQALGPVDLTAELTLLQFSLYCGGLKPNLTSEVCLYLEFMGGAEVGMGMCHTSANLNQTADSQLY